MAKPSTRQGLIDYCKRQLGAPVLEINVDDDQIDDLVDDAIQYFQERHYDGVERMYLKYKFTQADIDRGKATNNTSSTNTAGIVTTSATSTSISGYGTTTQIFTRHLTLFKYQTQLLVLKRFSNLILAAFLEECSVSSISYS